MIFIDRCHLKRNLFYLWMAILLIIFYKLLLIHFLQLREEQLLCSRNTNMSTINKSGKKLILFWTATFFGLDFALQNLNRFYDQRICPYSQCEITFNRSQLCFSSAVVFHLPDTFFNDLPPIKHRFQHQRYVLMSVEPPGKNPKFVARMNSFFNWTMTYRHDSDIFLPYVSWHRRSSPLTIKKNYLKNRPARILWIVSNCVSNSRREDYLKRLSKIVPTTILGTCRHSLSFFSSSSCIGLDIGDCFKMFARNHTYYFAFENSFCFDYITEKYQIQIALQLMIPIIYDAKPNNNYQRLAIPNSYIDASQFESPEALGAYLNSLTRTDDRTGMSKYDHYFQWVNNYHVGSDEKLHYTCELCRKLHLNRQRTKVYSNMKKWFFEDAHCYKWSDKHNRSIEVPLHETIRLAERVMDESLSIASI